MSDVERFFGAVKIGDVKTVKSYLNTIYPSLMDNLSIRLAVQSNQLEVLKILLLNPDVDPSDYGNRALIDAIYENKYEMVEVLLKDKRTDLYKNSPFLKSLSISGLDSAYMFLERPYFEPNKEEIIEYLEYGSYYEILKKIRPLLEMDPAKRSKMLKNIRASKNIKGFEEFGFFDEF